MSLGDSPGRVGGGVGMIRWQGWRLLFVDHESWQ